MSHKLRLAMWVSLLAALAGEGQAEVGGGLTAERGGTASTETGAAAEAAPPIPGVPALLRVRLDHVESAHGSYYWNQDLFVARDRTVMANSVANKTAVPGENEWLATRFTGVAAAADYAALLQALTDTHIGVRSDRCSVVNFDVLHTTGVYEITWYGILLRRSLVIIELNGGTSPECPADLLALAKQIIAFARATGVADFGPPFLAR
ncbi:MAG TPA: hypothetical protein VHR45_14920 [Thermoanaerobaculia bacterium]|nr:hypothetical protein [Thermoanaerobaculia bacterium]